MVKAEKQTIRIADSTQILRTFARTRVPSVAESFCVPFKESDTLYMNGFLPKSPSVPGKLSACGYVNLPEWSGYSIGSECGQRDGYAESHDSSGDPLQFSGMDSLEGSFTASPPCHRVDRIRVRLHGAKHDGSRDAGAGPTFMRCVMRKLSVTRTRWVANGGTAGLDALGLQPCRLVGGACPTGTTTAHALEPPLLESNPASVEPACSLPHEPGRRRPRVGRILARLQRLRRQSGGSRGNAATTIRGWEVNRTADRIAAARRSGIQTGPLVLVGYSRGANDALRLARRLQQSDIPVTKLILLETAANDSVPANVESCLNVYQSSASDDWIPSFRGLPVTVESANTQLTNYNLRFHDEGVARADLNHFTVCRNYSVLGMVSRPRGPAALADRRCDERFPAASGVYPFRIRRTIFSIAVTTWSKPRSDVSIGMASGAGLRAPNSRF